MTAEPPATQAGEPRQARKGATVSRNLRVIGDPLARAYRLGAPGGLGPDEGPHGPITYGPATWGGVERNIRNPSTSKTTSKKAA